MTGPLKTVIRLSSPPPPLSECFTHVRGRGKVATDRYKIWQAAVGWDVKAARPRRWGAGPVYIVAAFGSLPANSDLDNRWKGLLDLLVKHGVIDDDNIKVVPGINAYMAQVPFKGVEIAITSADPDPIFRRAEFNADPASVRARVGW